MCLSSCCHLVSFFLFPKQHGSFLLVPPGHLVSLFFCSFVFLFLTSIVIWTNGELRFKGLSWSGGLGVLKGGLLGIGGSKAKVGDWRF